MQNALLSIKLSCRQFLRAISVLNPRRVVRHFRSVSRRLDEIICLINVESASRAAEGLRAANERERRFGELEDRIRDLATQLEASTGALRAAVVALQSEVKRGSGLVESLGLDRWKLQEYEAILRYIRRKDYDRAIDEARLVVPTLETDHPVAISSNDTRFPRGSKNDNSVAPRFNRKLYQMFEGVKPIRVLDIGCAGGGFVRSLLDDGHFAVGLEGSDYPLLNQCGEWSTIASHLFPCDVTKPFRLTDRANNQPLLFDAITGWEVMEHIPDAGLPGLFENLDRHLAPGGLLLFSIATFLDWDHQTGVVWHVTVKPRSWWEDRFARLGFEVEDAHPFGKDDWLRGSGQCRGDWHEDDGLGFHIALRRKANSSAAGLKGAAWLPSVA